MSLRIITGIRVNRFCALKACIRGSNDFAGIRQYPVHALNSFDVRVTGTRDVLSEADHCQWIVVCSLSDEYVSKSTYVFHHRKWPVKNAVSLDSYFSEVTV